MGNLPVKGSVKIGKKVWYHLFLIYKAPQ